MTMWKTIGALAIAGTIFGADAAMAQSGRLAGTWVSADGGARVKIAPCGSGVCGNIVWLREPIDRSTGRPKTDKHNPDEARRTRPRLGLQVISGMRPDGDNRYAGQIYNADDGKTYRSKLTLLSPTKAKVEGCVLVFCKGETWTRVD
ncbi:MAG: DUF2147 domain-containing protein [Pseudolabrys sp.]